MRTKVRQLAYLSGGLFLSLALAGFVAAQTTGGTGSGTGGAAMTCPDGSSAAAGTTCPTTTGIGTGSTSMTTCPNGTQVPAGTTCPTTMTTCPDGTQVASGTTCPTQESKCTSASGKWCKNSDGATGWCSYSSSPCPAYDEPSCTAQSGEWCKYTSGTGGYCATNGAKCPINDELTCVAKGRPWCKSAGAVATTASSGYCGEVGYKCPANDEPSCKAQGSQWCTSAGGTATSGWCQTTGDCPINDSGACAAKARIWCPYTSGTGGWCATSGYKCDGSASTGTTSTATSSTQANYTCTDGSKVSSASQCPSTTANYTCSDGTKVTDSSKCPATVTPVMSWPQSQSECQKYKGVWCPPVAMSGSSTSAVYSGSCMMAGQSCPKPSTANMMTCWDNTQVSTSTICPSTPTNSSDCSSKGGQWCFSAATGAAATSGWCTSKSNGCPKYPPAGQMTCPDNQTYASKLSDCPVSETATQTQQDVTYKTCADGTLVKKDAECPKTTNYTVCPDGTKVAEGAKCPPVQKDEVSVCLAKGNVWCVDKASGKPGFCAAQGACATSNQEKNTEQEKNGLTEKEVKQLKSAKKNLIQKFDTLAKFFSNSKVNDAESLAKVTALKEKVNSLQENQSSFDELELIADDYDTLKDIKDSFVKNGADTASEQDQVLQQKALKKLKLSIAKFAKQLGIINARITKLESKADFSSFLDPIKQLVTQAQTLIKQIQTAKSFDEARDAAESLHDIADDINTALDTVDQIIQLNGLLPSINKEIAVREKLFASTKKLALKLGVDLTGLADELDNLLESVRGSYKTFVNEAIISPDAVDFLQANIIDKLDDIDDKLSSLKTLTNLKAGLKQTGSQITKYDTQIKRLAKKKKDITEMQALLTEIKTHYSTVQTFAKQKVSEDNVSAIVDELNTLSNLNGQMDDLLQLNAPSKLEKIIKTKAKESEKLKSIDIPDLEVSLIRAYRVATFVRRTPTETASFVTIGGPRKINTTRGAFAQDQ
ncbi:MAG: hypothetical protein HY981_03230 [Candidatus Magasanikbacteria bacterium]|nr:hypothetical protein [Candidatus Magasanikbacteria bacterium]